MSFTCKSRANITFLCCNHAFTLSAHKTSILLPGRVFLLIFLAESFFGEFLFVNYQAISFTDYLRKDTGLNIKVFIFALSCKYDLILNFLH